jgi:hypothetical protein
VVEVLRKCFLLFLIFSDLFSIKEKYFLGYAKKLIVTLVFKENAIFDEKKIERLSLGTIYCSLPWRRGIVMHVVITSAYRTEDPGFESRQGVRFLGSYTFQCCCCNLICIVIVCTLEK